MGSQASGDTGLKTWISGIDRPRRSGSTDPHRIPIGTAISEAMRKPAKTVWRLVQIWSK